MDEFTLLSSNKMLSWIYLPKRRRKKHTRNRPWYVIDGNGDDDNAFFLYFIPQSTYSTKKKTHDAMNNEFVILFDFGVTQSHIGIGMKKHKIVLRWVLFNECELSAQWLWYIHHRNTLDVIEARSMTNRNKKIWYASHTIIFLSRMFSFHTNLIWIRIVIANISHRAQHFVMHSKLARKFINFIRFNSITISLIVILFKIVVVVCGVSIQIAVWQTFQWENSQKRHCLLAHAERIDKSCVNVSVCFVFKSCF